jgi:hypothetical protein
MGSTPITSTFRFRHLHYTYMYNGDDMKTINCKCNTCGNTFEKELKEYNRQIRNGRDKFYCGLKCTANRIENKEMIKRLGTSFHFKGGENKFTTEEQKIKSSMRDFAKRVRARKAKFVEELDLDRLIEIWNSQNGKCKFTNVDLVLQHQPEYKIISNNYKASIDRIDSSKPYTIDNIQFISYTSNSLKSNMTDEEVKEFFNIIRNK